MLIWDTGEYSILEYRQTPPESGTDAEDVDDGASENNCNLLSDSEKLHQAFQQRKIRLQLHGTRLPPDYTLAIRMSRDHVKMEQPHRPARRRRRRDPKSKSRRTPDTSDSDDRDSLRGTGRLEKVESLHRTASPPAKSEPIEAEKYTASDGDSETIRLSNAYTGATNNIGSIHQRKWYLSLDRHTSGFVPRRSTSTRTRRWERKRDDNGVLHGFEKFWVMGRDEERSVLTGRLAKDIMEDEGVVGYIPRGLWRPVTE